VKSSKGKLKQTRTILSYGLPTLV